MDWCSNFYKGNFLNITKDTCSHFICFTQYPTHNSSPRWNFRIDLKFARVLPTHRDLPGVFRWGRWHLRVWTHTRGKYFSQVFDLKKQHLIETFNNYFFSNQWNMINKKIFPFGMKTQKPPDHKTPSPNQPTSQKSNIKQQQQPAELPTNNKSKSKQKKQPPKKSTAKPQKQPQTSTSTRRTSDTSSLSSQQSSSGQSTSAVTKSTAAASKARSGGGIKRKRKTSEDTDGDYEINGDNSSSTSSGNSSRRAGGGAAAAKRHKSLDSAGAIDSAVGRVRFSERRFGGEKPFMCNHCPLNFSSQENKG